MSVKVYIMVATTPGTPKQVHERLTQTSNVTDVREVIGPYDIVVEIQAGELPEVPAILNAIRSLDGIQSTTSLVCFPTART